MKIQKGEGTGQQYPGGGAICFVKSMTYRCDEETGLDKPSQTEENMTEESTTCLWE